MSEMPTLGEPAATKSKIAPIALTAIIIGTVAGVAFWLVRGNEPAPPPPSAPVAAPAVAVAPPPPAAPAPPATSFKVLTTVVNGPLESSITTAIGKDVGIPLTQVVTRSLVWWLRVPQDLARGDTLVALYEERPNQEPLVHAVRYTSLKLGKTWEAYRFKGEGEAFSRLYTPDGAELEERLADAPLDGYEQVTSLLRDGRGHKGVDFKTPAGTPVRATFDGVVARKTWNFRGNGNSLDLRETGGSHRNALYLHLSEVAKGLEPGKVVKKGDVIGKTGNTGHSFAPHLHYQLMRGEAVLDPFDDHSTRHSLAASQRPSFDKAAVALKGQLPPTTAPGG